MRAGKVYVLFASYIPEYGFTMMGVYSTKKKALKHVDAFNDWYVREYSVDRLSFTTVARKKTGAL